MKTLVVDGIEIFTDQDGYVAFGQVARNFLGMQSQYACRYINGFENYPNLGIGLRFKGKTKNYHSLKIHADDVQVFILRVKEHQSIL